MRGVRVGSVFGIPIKLNWSFLIVLPLFAAFIAVDITGIATVLNDLFGSTIDVSSLTTGTMPYVIGVVSALGLFLGVLLHEFGHSLVARRYGYEIDSITLWLFGGMASFAEFPEDWRHELWISVTGPVVSVLLGGVSYAAFTVVPPDLDAVQFVLGYLALLNVVLAVFNMLPAFPMDGGRVLRAILARRQPRAQATQQAAEVGKVFAFLLAIVGLFANLFLVLLALFIYVAASGEAQQVTMKAAFEDVTVADVMTPREDLDTVSEGTTIAELLERMFAERHVGYPVVENESLVGMVTLDDAANVREVERDAYTVADVMSTDVETVTPEENAIDALQTMERTDVGRLPVVDDDDLVGLVSRTDLMRAFNVLKTSSSRGFLQRADAGESTEPGGGE